MRVAHPVVVAAALFSGCGRLWFGPESELELELLVGVTTLDLTVCSQADDLVQLVVSRVPVIGEPSTESLAAVPTDAVVLRTELEMSVGECVANNAIVVDVEQTPIYVYAVTATATATATATMWPTWTRDRTNAGRLVWRHLPETYYRDPAAAMPALVFFHGYGHADGVPDSAPEAEPSTMPLDAGFLEYFGTGVPGTAVREPRMRDLPFAVLAPVCDADGAAAGESRIPAEDCWAWATAAAVWTETLTFAEQDLGLPLDRGRLFTTGLSFGGEGSMRAWYAHANDPVYPVAAAAPVAASLAARQAFLDAACAADTVPLWLFHSTQDTGNPNTLHQNSVDIRAAVNGCGPASPTVLTDGPWTFQGNGHAGWYETYTDRHGGSNAGATSIWTWMMAAPRPAGQ